MDDTQIRNPAPHIPHVRQLPALLIVQPSCCRRIRQMPSGAWRVPKRRRPVPFLELYSISENIQSYSNVYRRFITSQFLKIVLKSSCFPCCCGEILSVLCAFCVFGGGLQYHSHSRNRPGSAGDDPDHIWRRALKQGRLAAIPGGGAVSVFLTAGKGSQGGLPGRAGM